MTKTNPAITRKTTCFDFENTDTFVLSIAIIIPTIMESEHSNHVLDIFIR